MNNFLLEQLSKLDGCNGISFQINGAEAISLLEAVYKKGWEDAERQMRESIEKQQADEFITKAEAIKILGKSENTLWKWNRSNYLKAYKRGGTIMYKRNEVMAILNCSRN